MNHRNWQQENQHGVAGLGKRNGETKVKSEIRDKKLLIEFELGQPRLSQSGKSYVVASSRGPRQAKGKLCGAPVFIVANAIIYRKHATTSVERAAAVAKKSAQRSKDAPQKKQGRKGSTREKGNRHEE